MPYLSQQVMRRAARAAAAALLLTASAALAQGARPATAAPAQRTFTRWNQTPPAKPPDSPELLELGKRVYNGACQGCHGEKGAGDGREGKYLGIPPRDFTAGLFIVRSTGPGALPLDTDLFSSIKRGFVPAIGMPAFDFLSDREVWAVISYLKTFSPRWTSEQVPPPTEVPPPPARTPEAIAAGKEHFNNMGCVFCHGETGQGNGPSADALVYNSGARVRPANFTKPQNFKSGGRPEDLFLIVSNGMDGTPMPSFAAMLTPEQRWQVVFFLQSLAPSPPTAQAQK